MSSISLYYSADGACNFERLLQPARFCCDELEELGHQVSISNDLQHGFDWLVFHGIPPKLDILHRLQMLRDKGTKLLWSVDDDWTTIPDWNPAKLKEEGQAIFSMMKLMADAINCSTKPIAETFDRNWGSNEIFVCPNLIDPNVFPVPPYERGGYTESTVKLPIRCVWTGGDTHKGDIEVMVPVIDNILRKLGPETVQFVFAGLCPPPQLVKKWLHRGVTWAPAVPFNQYRKLANSLDPDIWLAPLASIPFNLSKSNLRILEGWALGAAVFASDWGEYRCIRDGTDGDVACSSEEWQERLINLILNHSFRLQMAADGRQRVKVAYNWNVRANRLPWLKMFGRLLGTPIAE